MASGKRQPSKQKRYSQNRQQRAALQVRKAAAAASAAPAPPPSAKKSRRWGRSAEPVATPSAAPAKIAPAPAPRVEPRVVAPPEPAASIGEAMDDAAAPPAEVEAVAAVEARVTEDAPPIATPDAPAAPKTLLGRLRDTSAANLPAAATGVRPTPAPAPRAAVPTPPAVRTPAARSPSTPAPTSRTASRPNRPTTVREAAKAGQDRALRRSNAQQRAALQPPGYRAAFTGLLAAFAAVLLCVLNATHVDSHGKLYTTDRLVGQWALPALAAARRAPGSTPAALVAAVHEWAPGRGSERLVQAYWPTSLAMVLPVLGVYLVFRAVKGRRSARVVTRAMYATLLGAFLTLTFFTFFLPAVIAVTVASYQVRKAETAALQAAAAGGANGVIEASVVDDG
jgi:hypothetical protein